MYGRAHPLGQPVMRTVSAASATPSVSSSRSSCVITSGKPLATNGVKASLLGTTKRADGRMQVTYNGHPLYTFVKDTKKGQTNGEELKAFGAEWYVVSPAGAKIAKSTAAGPAPTSGNGY